MTVQDRKQIQKMNDEMAGEALRVIGVAYRDTNSLPENDEEAESGLGILRVNRYDGPTQAEAGSSDCP